MQIASPPISSAATRQNPLQPQHEAERQRERGRRDRQHQHQRRQPVLLRDVHREAPVRAQHQVHHPHRRAQHPAQLLLRKRQHLFVARRDLSLVLGLVMARRCHRARARRQGPPRMVRSRAERSPAGWERSRVRLGGSRPDGEPERRAPARLALDARSRRRAPGRCSSRCTAQGPSPPPGCPGTRKNFSNSPAWCSRGIPGPLVRDFEPDPISRCAPLGSASRAHPTMISLPAGAKRMALAEQVREHELQAIGIDEHLGRARAAPPRAIATPRCSAAAR